MSYYFPFAYIIQNTFGAAATVNSRHPYFGEWEVCSDEKADTTAPAPQSLSEIYY